MSVGLTTPDLSTDLGNDDQVEFGKFLSARGSRSKYKSHGSNSAVRFLSVARFPPSRPPASQYASCLSEGCQERPAFGIPGDRSRVYCRRHRITGAVTLASAGWKMPEGPGSAGAGGWVEAEEDGMGVRCRRHRIVKQFTPVYGSRIEGAVLVRVKSRRGERIYSV